MKFFRSASTLLLLVGLCCACARAGDADAHAHATHKGECGPAHVEVRLTAAQRKARLQQILQPVKGAQRGSYAEVSRLITRQQWNLLAPNYRRMVGYSLRAKRQGLPLPAFCFAPGTDPRIVQTFDGLSNSLDALRIGGIWTQTATNASVARGQGFTLTWSLIADGTPIRNRDGVVKNSNLLARTRAAFGTGDDSALIERFTIMFRRYEELTGIRYVYEPNDSGDLATTFPQGELGVRGDIRIGGIDVDGPNNVLAFNYFPNTGDMVIDTSEIDARFTSDVFRLTIAHEHGHGLGLEHTCPTNQTKMMEPFVNNRFLHAQLDDILGVQRNYGDTNEAGAGNDTLATATSVGTRSVGTLTYGQFPTSPIGQPYAYITTQKPVTVDGSDDTDVYRFNVDAVGRTAAVVVRPVGESYLEGAQNSDGTCSAGTPLDPKTFAALRVELVNAAGDVLRQATGTVGQAATLSATGLSNTGPYYVRVSENGGDAQQIYTFDLVIGTRANAAPNISVNVTPKLPNANSTLIGAVTASDPNGDSVTLSYQWFRNEAPVTGATDNTLNLTSVGEVRAGDVFRLEVTASDGNPPPAVASDSVVVQEAPSLVVTTLNDVSTNDGLTSLREAATYAATLSGAQTISFAAGLSGTVTLNSELPQTVKALTIVGQSGLAISGGERGRLNTIGAGGALTLSNLVLRSGSAQDKGGLFVVNGGTLSATDCVLRNSSSSNTGGAVWAGINSTLSLLRCTVSDNDANVGGAFYLSGASASFDTCVLSNNTTNNFGGAVYVEKSGTTRGSIRLLNCQVNGNRANSIGGAVYIAAETPNGSTGSARNCTFVGNSSGGNGGAWADGYEATPFSNCSFDGNTAANRGGAIYDFFQLRVANCTFRNNSAPNGSAIGVDNGQTRLQNNIFDANGQAASLFFNSGGGGGSYESKGNNIASDGGGGFLTQASDRINTAPLVNAPANNGGFVTTLALQSGSPAINGGADTDATDINNNGNTTESLSAILITDARGAGFARKVGSAIDVGAFETQATNRPPQLNSATFTTSLNAPFSTQLAGSDPDGDALTYSLASGALPAGLNLSSAGLIAGTPTAAGSTSTSAFRSATAPAVVTARFLIIVSAASDGSAPVFEPLNLPSSGVTRDQLAAMSVSGNVRDVAPAGVVPVGVNRVRFQLRRDRDGFAYNGNAFTSNNSLYYPATLSASSDGTTSGTRSFSRSFDFLPPTLELGSYSLIVFSADNNNNYRVEIKPITIIAAPAATAPDAERKSAKIS